MKRFIVICLILFAASSVAIGSVLFIQRNSRSAIFCMSLNDSIRPPKYCLMNPFRNKQPEILAENILQELKNGNTNILLPYLNNLDEDRKNHFLENEKQYRIRNWRIGGREDSADTTYITYWVSRENYPVNAEGTAILESVHFDFARNSDEIRLRHFSAIY